ncbi:MAG: NAD(P)/FAD-dependent oxidoreductase [Burkholderiales bacterium]|nr:NAD(P)/FAD-dependent oxidoreductase [Burkholderiales bacterium]
MTKYDSIIIGAGAAGLMCAYTIALKQKKVALFDHSPKLAEKIRISGGGHCNFTNLYTKPECYISENPYFCISALSRYTPQHFCELLDKYNITYHEKTLGQLFCNNKSEEIINLLDFLCASNHVHRKMSVTINHIEKSSTGFMVNTTIGDFYTETLVIASGGLSIPQIGASPFGYNIAQQFGLAVIPPKPALVPLTLMPDLLNFFSPLSGISFSSKVSTYNISFEENSLLTHKGLSGPAILQISSYWNPGDNIKINMLPHLQLHTILEQNNHNLSENSNRNKLLSNFLHEFFPSRLADSICKMIQINKPINQLSKAEIIKISEFIHNLTIKPSGTLGYKKAEVTKGGVNTKYLSSKTMQANAVNGLFFIGEVVDVTGWLGGYNFQWAWASAHACGSSI